MCGRQPPGTTRTEASFEPKAHPAPACRRDVHRREQPGAPWQYGDGERAHSTWLELRDHGHLRVGAQPGTGAWREDGRRGGQRDLVLDRRHQHDAR